jgi:hypothetical protein
MLSASGRSANRVPHDAYTRRRQASNRSEDWPARGAPCSVAWSFSYCAVARVDQNRGVGEQRLAESVELASCTKMPILGLGTWQARGRSAVSAVPRALEVGYRHEAWERWAEDASQPCPEVRVHNHAVDLGLVSETNA